MKKYLFFVFAVMLVLFSTSCELNKALPDTVTIENKEYKKAFLGELYPLDRSFPDGDNEEGIRNSGEYYYKYPLTDFDCYIAYDNNAEPNIYFDSEQFDEAFSFYSDGNNFKFFCLMGNIHDENDQKIYEIQEVNPTMLKSLLEFAAENEYNPFTSFNNEDGLKKVPISDPNDWMADEIHFYQESKDGAFSTLKAYTFILYENNLCFLYRYDFTDEKSPVMLIRDVPADISDYFCALLKNLQNQ